MDGLLGVAGMIDSYHRSFPHSLRLAPVSKIMSAAIFSWIIIHRLSTSLWKSSNLPLRSNAPWLPPPTFWRPFLAPGADGDDLKTAQMWVINILIEWITVNNAEFMVIICLMMVNSIMVGGFKQPLWKIWVRQLGLWHSQCMFFPHLPGEGC